MGHHSAEFTKSELQGVLNSHEQKAKELLEDESRLKKLLEQAKALFKKLKKLPVIGAMTDDISTTISMIADYANRSYRAVPYKVLISAVAAIIYLVSPIDLIPDFIPFAGLIDDAAVLSLVFGMGLTAELKKYRSLKDKQPINVNKQSADIPEEINKKLKIIIQKISTHTIAAIFLTDDYYIEALLVEGSTKQELPMEVIPLVIPFPYDDVLEAFDGQHDHVIAYFDALLEDADLKWSDKGKLPFSMLRDFFEFDDYFDVKFTED